MRTFRQYHQWREAFLGAGNSYHPDGNSGGQPPPDRTSEYIPPLPPGGPPRPGPHGTIQDGDFLRKLLAILTKIDAFRDDRITPSGASVRGMAGTPDYMSPEMGQRTQSPGGFEEENEHDDLESFLVNGARIFPEVAAEAQQVMRAWLQFRNLFLPALHSRYTQQEQQQNYLYYKVTLRNYNNVTPLLKELDKLIMGESGQHNPAISTNWTAFIQQWRRLAPKLAGMLNQAMAEHPNPYQAEPIQMTQDVV